MDGAGGESLAARNRFAVFEYFLAARSEPGCKGTKKATEGNDRDGGEDFNTG